MSLQGCVWFRLEYGTSLAGQSLSRRDAANLSPEEENVNQWPQGLLVVGKSQHWLWCWSSNTFLPLSKHRVAFLISNHVSAHLQTPGWGLPVVSAQGLRYPGCSLGRLCVPAVSSRAPNLQLCRVRCSRPCVNSLNSQSRLFCGFFFMPQASPWWCHVSVNAPHGAPGPMGSARCCSAGSQQSFTAHKASRARLCLPQASFCRELEFLSALRSGLFFKTLLKELLFKIRFYFGRGLLSVSPFISKHVKSAKA